MNEFELPDYRYWATVTRIVDGDTIYADVDLGFAVSINLKLRLSDINTPEIRGSEKEEGLKAKAFVENLIKPGDEIVIESYKDGGFGRWAAYVWYQEPESPVMICLNDYLVDQGIAKEV